MADEPIDYERTTRPRAGMVFKDRRQLPGLALVILAVLAVAAFMSATAAHSAGWAIGLAIVALVATAGGVGWVLAGRNRTNRLTDQRRKR